MKNESGMTLVEITVSAIVLSIVVLAAGTVYVSAMRELQRITDESRAQVEASAALDHIYINLVKGIRTITIWDNQTNGLVSATYYDADGSLKEMLWRRNWADNTVEFFPDYQRPLGFDSTPKEKVASYISALGFRRYLMTWPSRINYVVATITATKGRVSKTYTTGVTLRSKY